MSYFILMGRRIPKQAITGFKFQNETDNIRPFLSKEDVDKIHSYGIKLPTNRLGNEGYFNSIALSDLESQIREVLKRCLSYKIVEEVPVIKYQLETNCLFSYDKRGMYVFLSAFCYGLFLRCYYHSLS